MVVIESGESAAARPASGALPLPPPYLAGRYDGAALWVVAPDEQRALDVGALIHADADQTDPLRAIGVVVRIVDGGAVALVAGIQGQAASVREPGRAVRIVLVRPFA